MIEEYTTTNGDNGDDYMCPFWLASSSTSCRCMGRRCMAWIVQLDDSGKPTGSGRCGMVGVILQMPVTTCASWDGDVECKDEVLIEEQDMEILYCPHCSGESTLVSCYMPELLEERYFVKCFECGFKGKTSKDKEKAITSWNRIKRT